jgi:hypothetical protein
MGNRSFYDQLLQDTIRQQQAAITDEVDVTTLKDYMQYLSNLDETPAYLGGKENYWRKLSLDGTCIIFLPQTNKSNWNCKEMMLCEFL